MGWGLLAIEEWCVNLSKDKVILLKSETDNVKLFKTIYSIYTTSPPEQLEKTVLASHDFAKNLYLIHQL